MNKPNKMAAVREVLSANADATPDEIVAALAKQNLKISASVASNYKSVIKSGSKRKTSKKGPGRKSPAPSTKPLPVAAADATNGSAGHGLSPEVIELLKAGRAIGWKRVRSIVDLMLES
jgi:hypothetical protein